ncbi:CPM (predicted) [Pycnogonum litorale]
MVLINKLLAFTFYWYMLLTETSGIKKYRDYTEMTEFLININKTYPQFVHLHSIGQSAEGRELWVMVISKDPLKQVLMKPNVKYVANLHGDEVAGRALLLRFITDLVTNYHTKNKTKRLLDNTYVHIMPSMNPDGFEKAINQCKGGPGRNNANGFDLNTNFPDHFLRNTENKQPEVEAIMRWMNDVQFTLSGHFRGGSLVITYPFNSRKNHDSLKKSTNMDGPAKAPDDDTLRYLAFKNAIKRKETSNEDICAHSRFRNGIKNAAQLPTVSGGMQDYNYMWAGCMEIDMFISCCKYTEPTDMPIRWYSYKRSMYDFLLKVHSGVKGIVVDEDNAPVEGVKMKIKGRDVVFKTTKRGEYWRILLSGNYTIVLDYFKRYDSKECYGSIEVNVQVPAYAVVTRNITLKILTEGLPYPLP